MRVAWGMSVCNMLQKTTMVLVTHCMCMLCGVDHMMVIHGNAPRLHPCGVFYADVHRTHKIFDFVVSAGWVNGVDDEAAGQGGSSCTRHSGPGSSAYPDGNA